MVDEINRRLDDHEERLKKVEASTSELSTFREVVNVKLDNITKGLEDVKDAVIELKSKPAALWEKLVSALIGAAASGFIAYILTR